MKILEDFQREIREEARIINKEFRENLRHSRFGLLKNIGFELASPILGASLAGIGRLTGAHWTPTVPLVMDIMTTGASYSSFEGLWETAKYGLGVAVVYADKIYPFVSEFIN